MNFQYRLQHAAPAPRRQPGGIAFGDQELHDIPAKMLRSTHAPPGKRKFAAASRRGGEKEPLAGARR